MTALVLGGVIGAFVGAATALATAVALLQARECPDPDAHQLTGQDRDAVAAEFATHALAVRRQVAEFADQLAGDDPVLRARLRQFEAGERS